jgi:LAO/AO transport system kinase
LIETVGVGQSEIEIVGLADITLLVLVPESGDEIQNIKSGLMEIADAFILNKADRADADLFANNLKKIIHQNKEDQIPIFKTIATTSEGISEVIDFILSASPKKNKRREMLLAEKAYRIIQRKRMTDVNKKELQHAIAKALSDPDFNLYNFVDSYF